MNNRLALSVTVLFLAVQSLLASAPANYYNSAEGNADKNLMTALRNIIYNHTQLSYSKVWDAFKTTDTDADGYIIDMYSDYRYLPADHGTSANYIGSGYNREHSFPKSWFDDAYPMYTDIHHLYPTDVCINQQRGNYPFGVCANGDRITTGQYSAKGKLGYSTYPGYTGMVFEPDDEYKGDFARTYFYMVTCYMNELPSWPRGKTAQLDFTNGYKAFSNWSINMLMEWTRMDPVSEKEIKRNDAVFLLQGNRNPYIDHPELAEYIWGDKQGQEWPDGGTISPALIEPVNGSVIDMGATYEGKSISMDITVKGKALTEDITLSISNSAYFSVNTTTFSASDVNNGTTLTVTFNGEDIGFYENHITLSSGEVSTIFTVTASCEKEPEPEPESTVEDWEGCSTGGYWNKVVQGHTWTWNFTDAGIWSDNLSNGELSCRLGKTSSSSIAMAEDFEGGVSGIGFWAACYGSDGDATLSVEYSTDHGFSWNDLGSFTFTRGALQHITMDIIVSSSIRFRIVQHSGMRVNIDDIALYSLVQEEEELVGDVNGDHEVNIVDINILINIILGNPVDENTLRRADVNKDNEVNVTDINAVVNIILGHKA